MPDSDSEFRNGVRVTHPGGQTGHPTLPFDTAPCDGGLRQRVERVTLQARATGGENNDDRLVHGTDASDALVTRITIFLPLGAFARIV